MHTGLFEVKNKVSKSSSYDYEIIRYSSWPPSGISLNNLGTDMPGPQHFDKYRYGLNNKINTVTASTLRLIPSRHHH